MYITIKNANTYVYTGGKPFNPAQPSIVFIHGVVNDHSVWVLQSRYFAHHGFNVLAVDLPGHCKSEGVAPASVEDAARFVVDLLDALHIERAALVGHSFGSLIALEAAARLGDRATHAALIGCAYPMKVSPALLESSLNTPEAALKMINVLSRSTLASPPSTLGPGTWVYGGSLALGRRVLRSNTAVNVFHRGFSACNDYAGGEAAMARVTCPVKFILGEVDQMTQAKGAQLLINVGRLAEKNLSVDTLPVGHHQMSEAPEAILAALKGFLSAAKT